MDLQSYRSTLSEQQSAMLKAVESDTLSKVQDLVNNYHDLDQNELFAYILLVAALHREDKPISMFLIEKELSVKSLQKTGSYCTPLYYAIKMNDLDIFKALCRRGASIFSKDTNRESALELAMHKTNSKSTNHNRPYMIDFTINEIVFNGTKDLEPECDEDVALFHAACWTSNFKAIRAFMYFDFSARSRSRFLEDKWRRFTPLHFVFKGIRPPDESASFLLEHDDNDFHAQDTRGRTCIHLAFRKRQAYLFRKNAVIKRIRSSNNSQPINSVDENGLSHFHIFCSMKILKESSEEHIGLIKYFIDNEVDVNSSVSLEDKDYPGFTALHFAIKESSWEVFKLLLDSGADTTKTDKFGRTALHLVCDTRTNYLENVRSLLQCGANPNAQDAKGRTPLHYAFRLYREVSPLDECGKLLLSRNQDGINYTDDKDLTYLHMACTGDDLKIIEALLINSAPMDWGILSTSHLHSGYTPLHFAVESQQLEVVRLLLYRGADPNCAADVKGTPLYLACGHRNAYFHRSQSIGVESWLPSREKYIRIIELLIEHGASVNAASPSGSTPLLQNCSILHILFNVNFSDSHEPPESLQNELFTRQEKVMDILLRHGADINACSKDGGIIHILINNLTKCPRNQDLMKIALEREANIDAVSENRGTPLCLAVEISMKHKLDMSLINFLLEHGADINGKTKNFETPIHTAIACYNSGFVHEDIIGSLLDHPQVDLDVRNDRGQTPLHIAYDYFLIRKLLDSGSNVNVADNGGNPPFHGFWLNLEKYGQNWRNERNSNILSAIITHIKKLMRLNFFVSAKVRHYLEIFSDYLSKDDLALIDSEIDDEIKRLKSEKMDQYSSLYDMIFKSPNSLAEYAQNENFLRVIKTIRSKQDFAIFGDLINRQYKRGVRRRLVLEPARTALNNVTNMNWPQWCSKLILDYFSDEDIRILIKSSCANENCTGEPTAKGP